MENNLLIITSTISIPFSAVEFTFVRSSGPGGQNVNKVSSKAVMRWSLRDSVEIPDDAKGRFATLYPSYLTEDGEVILTGQRFRDAPKNKEDCLEKLREMLTIALKKPKRRIPTRPTRGSIERRLAGKSRLSEKKERRKPIQPD